MMRIELWAVIVKDRLGDMFWNGHSDTPRLYKTKFAAETAIKIGKRANALPVKVILRCDE